MRGLLGLAVILISVPWLTEEPKGGGQEALRPSADSAWTLFAGLAAATDVEVVCADERLRPAVERAIERSRSATPHALAFTTPADSDAGRPRIVVGLLDDPFVRDLAHAAGVADAAGESLRIESTAFKLPNDVMVATVADPERAGLPLTLHLGFDAAVLAADLAHVTPSSRLGVVVRRAGVPQLRLPVAASGRAVWADKADFSARRREAARSEGARGPETVRVQGSGIDVRLGRGVDRDRAQAYAALLAEIEREVRATFGVARRSGAAIEVRAVGSLEDHIHLYGAASLSSVGAVGAPEQIVATSTLAPGIPDDGGDCAARAVLLQAFGPPVIDWIADGAGGAVARTYWGRPMEAWVAYLVDAGLAPTAAELVRVDAARRISPHALVPLRGVLFRELLEREGAAAVAAMWTGDAPFAIDDAIEQRYRTRLDAIADEHRAALLAARNARHESALDAEWIGGVHVLAARGDQDGPLGASRLAESLANARAAGATSAAFSPLVYLAPRPRELAGDPLAAWPDAEPGDLALLHALFAARAAGMRTALAPQLIGSPTGTWADSHALWEDADVAAIFADSARALQHYAMLGEIAGVDLLCLGNESNVISMTGPDPAARPAEADPALDRRLADFRAHWKDLIGRTRRAFGGALTYAAEPFHELPRVELWEDLDYVGVDLFAPILRPSGPSSAAAAQRRMTAVLEDCLAIAAAHERPLLLMQVGFPSHSRANSLPAVASGTPDPTLQKDLFDVLAAALDDVRASGALRGLFLWRWDPDPGAGGSGDASHTPQNKPAQAVVPRLLAP